MRNSNNNSASIEDAISKTLVALGEDLARPGLLDTPKRVAKSLRELTSGYAYAPSDVVGNAIFPCASKGMVVQSGIEFFSLCEHHLLPFFGHIHLAYLPHKKIIGLSKIGRVIDIFAKRLQVQENLTREILKSIDDLLIPKGTAIKIEASHLCMMMRGVGKQGSKTVTTEYSGVFNTNESIRNEFLRCIKK